MLSRVKIGVAEHEYDSYSAEEVAKYPKVVPNSRIMQNSVQAYCLALLSNATCFVLVSYFISFPCLAQSGRLIWLLCQLLSSVL